jgi:hypothetical protein
VESNGGGVSKELNGGELGYDAGMWIWSSDGRD